jgi:hypothetical protein
LENLSRNANSKLLVTKLHTGFQKIMLEIYGLNSNVTLGSYCFSNSDVKGENVLHYEKIFNPLFGNEIIILSDVKDGIFLEISDVLWRPLDITQNNHHVTLLGVVQSSQKAE